MNGFDFSELGELIDSFNTLGQQFPKETDKLLKKAGSTLGRWIKKGYRLKTKKITGNLLKNVKPGKPFVYGKDNRQIRVYSKAPHAHLVDYGHQMLDKNKNPVKHGTSFVKGRKVVATEQKAFESEFYTMVDKWIDDFLEV